jgi:aryl-alcohol dehydrogenase-like predicted oxidoreductase
VKYRELGRTGVRLSEVGFGVWTVSTGWWGNHQHDEAVDLLRRAFDLGITFFDTADVYGDGYGETLLRDALAPVRGKCAYATKVGYDWYNNKREGGQREHPHDWSPAFIRHAVEQSLARLGSDYIDWLQLHNPRMDALESFELEDALIGLHREGKIRAWGVALGPAIGWRDEGIFALQRGVGSMQIIHNLLEQDPGREFIDAGRSGGAGFVARVPHSSGLLEGHYTTDTTFPEGDHRNHRPRQWLLDGIQKVEQLRFLEAPRRTLGQAAIQWLLAEPAMASVLPNIYDEAQLREFAAASESPPLSPVDLERVQALYVSNFGLAAGVPA